ncbi:hypothetical protein QBC43DRAFT_198160 [Cladorrhinum sp. PSN259]|nr:hypothetical protein QBC43DRAFT_198160 [Cladorrhinum sp. PSN259]
MNYTSLDSSSSQTRLLRLFPQTLSDELWHQCTDIECSFETVALESAPPYEALSYAWGNEDPTVEILIDGRRFLIRPNLAYALAALRTTEPRLLWVDALCINQDNVHERNHQVRLMGDIYRRATTVLVWLGRPSQKWSSSVAGALRMAKRLGDNHPKPILSTPPPQPHVEHEPDFDRWINSEMEYIASNTANLAPGDAAAKTKPKRNEKPPITPGELARIQFEGLLERWNKMKIRRVESLRARERLPEMTAEVRNAESFLALKRDELDRLRTLVARERAVLDDLIASELEQRHIVEEGPILRRLLAFRDSQRQAFQDADLEGCAMELGVFDYMQSRRQGRKTKLHSAAQKDEAPESAQRVHKEIRQDLGSFQHSTSDLKEYFERNCGTMSAAARKRWTNVLQRLHQTDVKQRRSLTAMEHQLEEWQLSSVEREAHSRLAQLFQERTSAFRQQVRRWSGSQRRTLQNLGTVSKLMSQQQAQMQDFVRSQCEELERRRRLEEDWWNNDSRLAADQFLTAAEINMFEEARKRRRARHRQWLVLQQVELKKSGIEASVNRHHRWQQEIHSMASNLRSDASFEKESLDLQRYWVQVWHSIMDRQAKEWESTVFDREGQSQQLLDEDLLSLQSICDLPYWKRLWIVQEVLLAEKLTLCFGDDFRRTRSWEILTMARSCLKKLPNTWKLNPRIQASIDRIKHAIPFELDTLRENRAELWPLHTLIDITECSLSQDPRDKVYGLLGLASDFHYEDFDIDYKKPLEEVYRDVIQWYHSKHGKDHDSCSLVGFSQMLQLSLRGHCEEKGTGDIPLLAPLNEVVQSACSTGKFTIKGTIRGTILPLEKLLGDGELVATAQRDWISTMVEYSHHMGSQRVKNAIEHELVFLDSIAASPSRTSEARFFITSDGDFGISSSGGIREDDLLCEFQDSHLGLILRGDGDSHKIVAEAILSSSAYDSKMGGSHLEQSVTHPLIRTPHDGCPSMDVTLDINSLQDLTKPPSLPVKQVNRVPLYIQEADFGWYEFITYGIDVPPGPIVLRQRHGGSKIEPQESEQQPDLVEEDAEETTYMLTAESLPEDWARSIVARWREMASGIAVNLENADDKLQLDVSQLIFSPPASEQYDSRTPTLRQSSIGLVGSSSQVGIGFMGRQTQVQEPEVMIKRPMWLKAKSWAARIRWLKL